ncbi:MAG: type II secretion system F family protein [Candidatus Aureabacteria bacterium]|nr:type II secretion system F family protein [Candidatus Auribacterota bacterium]
MDFSIFGIEGLVLLIWVSLFSSVVIFVYSGYRIFTQRYSEYEENFVESTSATLDEYFIFVAPQKILFIKFLLSFMFFLIFCFMTFTSPFLSKYFIVPVIFGAVGGAVGFFIPEWFIKYFINRRAEKFGDQLVDGLTTISNCLKAGLSFGQGLEMMVEDMEPPISQEFSVVLKENRLGKSLEESLNNLNERIDNPDLVLIVVSVNIAREIGGNLAEIFDRIANVIRERNVLKKKIDALTSQGKLQGWVVGAMPLVMGMILYKLQPDIFSLLFTSIWGWITIAVVIILEIFGMLLIRKIVNIDI